MKIISVLFLVAGILLGPAYAIYCGSLSGSEAGSYQIFSQDINRAGFGGLSVQSKGASEWKTPIMVNLSPDMNPVSFIASVNYMPPIRVSGTHFRKNYYSVQLEKEDIPVWEGTFMVSYQKPSQKSSSNTSLSYHSQMSNIKTFFVREPGEYSFTLQPKGKTELDVSSIRLTIKRNVVQPNQAIVIAGFILMVLSIIGFVISNKLAKS